MSELEAKERYYWSKIRQALKIGNVGAARDILMVAAGDPFIEDPLFICSLEDRVGKTFTAGCAALGDPAPLDKENDHE